jgi:chitin synthase
MYLAEDRILCFEVLAHKDAAWTLRYVKNATAGTDVPERLTSLIRQRRRWLNGWRSWFTALVGKLNEWLTGSLFATVYVIANFNQFWQSSTHKLSFKLFISLLFSFYACSLVLTWFLPANFYLMFHFAAANSSSDSLVFNLLEYLFYYVTVIQVWKAEAVIRFGSDPSWIGCIGYRE